VTAVAYDHRAGLVEECGWCGYGVLFAAAVEVKERLGTYVELVEVEGWTREWAVHRRYCGMRPWGVEDD
jgi:hypothetical protein